MQWHCTDVSSHHDSGHSITLKNKLFLAALLTPAFWLLLMWIFFVSAATESMSFVTVLFQSLAFSFVGAYSITLFVASLKRISDKT